MRFFSFIGLHSSKSNNEVASDAPAPDPDPPAMESSQLPNAMAQDASSPLSSIASCAPSIAPSPAPSSASSDSGLSTLSRSPTPPAHLDRLYPSPLASQQSSAKSSPAPRAMATTPPSSDNDGPPRKKRKVAEPKQRTTERLDLASATADDAQLKRLMDVLNKKRKIVVIAGAGISVSAGIPDFRSAGGLFNSLRKQHKLKSSGKDLFDASVYSDDTSTSTFHDMVRSLSHETKKAQPTAFHHLLATLAQEGRLLRLYSQNVDGIDASIPPLKTQVPLPKKGPWPKTVQLHGGLDHMVCSKCSALSNFDAEKFNGPTPPACGHCQENDAVRAVAEKRSHGIGRLRPRMVLYNEHNPDDEAIGSCVSADLRTRPDAVIVAGTTLKVPGVRRIAREMCATVRDRRDGVAIWINNDPEPLGKDLSNSWDIIVKGPCDDVAEKANMRKWDQPPVEFKVVSDNEVESKKQQQRADVMIPSSVACTPKKLGAVDMIQGQLTPGQSPRMGPQRAIKLEAVDPPSTPSKKQGTKRKSGGGQTAISKAAKPKAVSKPQKKRAPKSKAKQANENPKITSQFAVSKSSTTALKSSIAGKASKFISYDPAKKENKPIKEIHETVCSTSLPEPMTPKSGKVTAWKPTARETMLDLPTADPRNNSAYLFSPTRPDVEPFTSPAKPTEDWDANDSRPSTASSRRDEIEHPTGAVPHFTRDILC
ncbi:DHS-like NAD/FAD-binding domain-containing protein [Aaosphaeria arxii CBS 175.79]|uniref:DHS-like NAD/FAD-binding domain-containing protein n=1 Tax=Aaosphaeria arxii CBS 175.79 TaxID=1450172 RepID=A0A6A5Y0I6_9PLEO|nr:DHS-like NAD/FAD-binding domain-containing protein [Aaosphaeria arxii CBS 175.79]KAF2018962.1 DHS-like NAD/FAD-binding domain-containing protein [Aaosphaeria arxii CBS 175.79]